MSTINGVNSTYSEQAAAAASGSSAKTIDKSTKDVTTNEFLKLLVTQLQNQDPLDPMDNSQFLTQLATFSSMEQLISINEGVTSLSDAFVQKPSEKDAAE
ncbi:MAG: flagellar hook capping FlgD N-terminal domain-containing protein [Acidobacteriota bacterium]|jgi:flagellar basal-body rod modification protein FlgD|nr:flagellar hook capping FlgD N-terminal domain-containing protein [Acidobacteriota bacterium]